ncbi:alkaline phosphatase PhoX [Sulfurimonas sp.]|uniref:alkaline phosphatase PhoX n=1 Tax=Sulfurimonas sp. TaxID=2022749 RepID=UPI002607102E|nr:alkaline phosphatase PhoX [Sulfurimonas sp.]
MNKYISLAASAVVVLSMVGCNSNNGTDGTNSTALIKSVSVPTTDAEKAKIRVANAMDVDFITKPLSYKTILRTGTTLGNETFGLLKDENDAALKLDDGSNYICNGQFGGSGPDHTEFIQKGDKTFMITQFECQVGAIYQAELEQNPTTGELTAKNLKYISEKAYHGGYVHCAGMKTPWNSFLGSEEYEPNARDLNTSTGSISKYYDLVAPYFGGDLKKASPYYYGWITEVKITDKNGADSYTKHYSMGRFAHELAYIMPDSKTAYLSDDGTNDGFYMYVADIAGELTAGTLYAAKWKQTSSEGAGAADLSWIKLGHATDAELKDIVDSKPLFTDIFDTEDANATNECPTAGYKAINTGSGGLECLKVKSGKEKEAAFLETRRYAAYLGATTEFRKFEGITYNSDNNKLYTAISQVAKGMEDFKKYGKDKDSYDKGGNNDIKLAYDKCGAVYDLSLNSSIKDTSGTDIDSAYVATNMTSIIEGEMKSYPANSIYADNSCNVNSIASPDNISYKQGSNLLLIGEDTGYHQNDMIWAFDTETNKLTARVATTPFGSETTSVMFQKPINGYEYINFVTQHPYGESDKDKVKNPDDVQSYVGYMQIGGKE